MQLHASSPACKNAGSLTAKRVYRSLYEETIRNPVKLSLRFFACPNEKGFHRLSTNNTRRGDGI